MPGTTISLTSSVGTISSFVLNTDTGTETITGSTFTMPKSYVYINNIIIEVVYESEHNPYPSGMKKKVYVDKTFDGANSIDVSITYETQNTVVYPDYINVYDGSGDELKKLKGKKSTENFTIYGNHIMITITSIRTLAYAYLENEYGKKTRSNRFQRDLDNPQHHHLFPHFVRTRVRHAYGSCRRKRRFHALLRCSRRIFPCIGKRYG